MKMIRHSSSISHCGVLKRIFLVLDSDRQRWLEHFEALLGVASQKLLNLLVMNSTFGLIVSRLSELMLPLRVVQQIGDNLYIMVWH